MPESVTSAIVGTAAMPVPFAAQAGSTLSTLGAQITATVAPKASFVVMGIPMTAAILQWLAVAGVCAALAAVFARRRHTHIEPSIWWAAVTGIVVARAVYLVRNWSAYRADPVGQGTLSWVGQVLDVRDGGMAMGAGLAVAMAVLVAAGWRKKGLRKPLLATVCAAGIIWSGAGVALHAGASSRPALPDWTFATVDVASGALLSHPTAQDRSITLQPHANQPTVVNLWATWCGPCRREMPALARAQKDYPGIRIVFANQGETPEKVSRYLNEAGLSLANVVLDTDARLGTLYRSSVVPTTLFFYADGRFAEVHFGELSEPALHAVLDKLQAADQRS
jgi:thiol-disulfide isomerase/thioredoxin